MADENGWASEPIGPLLDGIIDYRGKTPPKSAAGIPLISAANVKRGRVVLDDPEFIGLDDYKKWTRRGFTQPGDVLITTEAPAGEVAPYPRQGVYQISRRVMALRPNCNRLDSNFLLYALLWPDVNQRLLSFSRGTTVPRVLKTDITGLSIPLPPLPEQKAIANILGSLDAKIELNRRMNETLESLARAIFKSWFFDFDPVRAKMDGRRPPGMDQATADLFPDAMVHFDGKLIPKGWQLGIVVDVARSPRRTVKPEQIEIGTPYIGLEHMPRRSIALSDWGVADSVASGKYQFKTGDVLFGKLRPYFHKVGVPALDGVCSTDVVVVEPAAPEWFGFVLETLASDDFVSYTDMTSTGTRMPRTNWKDMARFPVTLPPATVASAFNGHAVPVVSRIHSQIQESRTLATLRDTLLPKLLSGELRVPEAEKAVEGVL